MPRRNFRTKPIKHQPYQLKRGDCSNKKSYDSEQTATWAAQDQMKYSLDIKITAYHCDVCGKWHLTSHQN